MTIEIEGAEQGPSWEALQTFVRSLYRGAAAQEGTIVRMSRPDGGTDYRALGRYECTVAQSWGENVTLTVVVS